MCLFPVVLTKESRVRGYDGSSFTRMVPCGKCIDCLQKRRNDWVFRIKQELKVSSSAFFVTLTYNDENLPRDENDNPCVEIKDVQLFFKRLRKKIQPHKIRYFLTSEYGGKTYRPHYHFILFNFPYEKYDINKVLRETWKNGFIMSDKVTHGRIHYVTKYCMQDADLPDILRKPFMTCSRRPAIGANYMSEKIKRYHKSNLETTIITNGYRYRLPKYYQDRIFDDYEKMAIKIRNLEYSRKKAKEFYEKYKDYDNLAMKENRPSMYVEFQLKKIRQLAKQFKKDNL